MAERVLILGTTGTEKAAVLSKLERYAQSQPVKLELLPVHFENDCVLKADPRLELHGYLDAPKDQQKKFWLHGWEVFKSLYKDKANQSKTILLSMHGVLTRSLTGTQSPIDIKCLRDFSPTKIITLIDDVYIKRYRTAERAKGMRYRGMPTLEELLDARRTEIFLGDLIASHVSRQPAHYVLAVRHPVRALYRLLCVDSKGVKTVYLSFPISDPRTLLKDKKDDSGIREVNEFLKKANEFESKNPQVVCFCPLTIDEYPLLRASKKGGFKVLQLKSRWDVREFYEEELLFNNADLPTKIEIPSGEVEDAAGFIKADVSSRDYRLVLQSKRLAILNPWFEFEDKQGKIKGELTGGVRNEIRLATKNCIPCHIYQNPLRDKRGKAKEMLDPRPGSLGWDPSSVYITFHETIDGLFKALF